MASATNVHSTSKIQVLCLSTLYTPYKSVTRVVCNFWIGTKGVWTIRCNYHQVTVHLHAVDLIIIGSSIIFKYGGYQQCRITVVSPCAGYPYHFAKGYLDHSRIGFHGLYSKFTSSWCLCLPNAYKRWQKHSTRKFGFETGGSWSKSSPEADASVPTGFPEARKRHKAIQALTATQWSKHQRHDIACRL